VKEATMTPQEQGEAFRRQMAIFIPNRAAFPLEELERYRNHYIAFDPEGTRIIAATERAEDIDTAIRAAGYDSATCPVEFVE
jgi:hypothetical protein